MKAEQTGLGNPVTVHWQDKHGRKRTHSKCGWRLDHFVDINKNCKSKITLNELKTRQKSLPVRIEAADVAADKCTALTSESPGVARVKVLKLERRLEARRRRFPDVSHAFCAFTKNGNLVKRLLDWTERFSQNKRVSHSVWGGYWPPEPILQTPSPVFSPKTTHFLVYSQPLSVSDS